MKKILIVRSNPNSPRVLKEAVSLKKAGYLVDILCWDRNSNKSNIKMNDGIATNYFGFKAPYGKLNLILYLIIWNIYEFIFLLKNNYYAVHICGFDSLLPAILIKILKKEKLVYDIFDFYAESLPSGIPQGIVYLIAYLEKFCIRFTDSVIIVDKCRYIQIEGSKIKNMSIIMNCPNEITFESNIPLNYKKFTVLYAGMISKTRGLEQLINAIKDENDINLIVAGTGEDESYFKPIFSKMNNVIFKGQISYEESLNLTFQVNVIFGFYDPTIPNNRLASPNKLFEAMMCSTPIIVNEETSMAEIVKQNNCGLIVPYNNCALLKESILKLKENPQMCLNMGENGRKAFEREYNWQVMSQRLIELYNNIAQKT